MEEVLQELLGPGPLVSGVGGATLDAPFFGFAVSPIRLSRQAAESARWNGLTLIGPAYDAHLPGAVVGAADPYPFRLSIRHALLDPFIPLSIIESRQWHMSPGDVQHRWERLGFPEIKVTSGVLVEVAGRFSDTSTGIVGLFATGRPARPLGGVPVLVAQRVESGFSTFECRTRWKDCRRRLEPARTVTTLVRSVGPLSDVFSKSSETVQPTRPRVEFLITIDPLRDGTVVRRTLKRATLEGSESRLEFTSGSWLALLAKQRVRLDWLANSRDVASEEVPLLGFEASTDVRRTVADKGYSLQGPFYGRPIWIRAPSVEADQGFVRESSSTLIRAMLYWAMPVASTQAVPPSLFVERERDVCGCWYEGSDSVYTCPKADGGRLEFRAADLRERGSSLFHHAFSTRTEAGIVLRLCGRDYSGGESILGAKITGVHERGAHLEFPVINGVKHFGSIDVWPWAPPIKGCEPTRPAGEGPTLNLGINGRIFSLGDPINVKLTLTNETTGPLALMDYWGGPEDLSIFREDGRELEYSGPIPDFMFMRPPFSVLQVKKSWVEDFHLNPTFHGMPGAYHLFEPGAYRVKAAYSSSHYECWHSTAPLVLPAPSWAGKAESPTVEIEIQRLEAGQLHRRAERAALGHVPSIEILGMHSDRSFLPQLRKGFRVGSADARNAIVWALWRLDKKSALDLAESWSKEDGVESPSFVRMIRSFQERDYDPSEVRLRSQTKE